MNSLAADQEYQKLRKAYRQAIGAQRPSDLPGKVMTELFRTHPEAHWVKFANGRMFAINERYSEQFGVPLLDYINTCDSSIWSAISASSFDTNDKAVIAAGCPMTFVERCEKGGEYQDLSVTKWPMSVELSCGKEVQFVAGKLNE